MGNSFIPGPNMGGGIIYIFSLLIYNKNPLVICPISDCFLVGIFKKKIEAMNSDFIIFLKQQKFCRKVWRKTFLVFSLDLFYIFSLDLFYIFSLVLYYFLFPIISTSIYLCLTYLFLLHIQNSKICSLYMFPYFLVSPYPTWFSLSNPLSQFVLYTISSSHFYNKVGEITNEQR